MSLVVSEERQWFRTVSTWLFNGLFEVSESRTDLGKSGEVAHGSVDFDSNFASVPWQRLGLSCIDLWYLGERGSMNSSSIRVAEVF